LNLFHIKYGSKVRAEKRVDDYGEDLIGVGKERLGAKKAADPQ